jgi:ribosome biogenesis GTPase
MDLDEKYRVTAVSRNCIFVSNDKVKDFEIPVRSKSKGIIVGDYCLVDIKTKSVKILERANQLIRSYSGKTKYLAANIDHLFIVTAHKPGINYLFIDRTICASLFENIQCSLVLNKTDLERTNSIQMLNFYKELGINIIESSTKVENGITELSDFISNNKFKTVALCGISGVGKSSLINKLVADANQTIQAISDKTESGKQTTTMAKLFSSKKYGFDIIDLPGLQNFGVSHLPLKFLPSIFPEIFKYSAECRFNDCNHINEPDCKVLEQLDSCMIQLSRYKSYLSIREELIQANKP